MSLNAENTTIAVKDSASEVELSCEMTLFIREDEDMQWFKEGQKITNGTNRHTITYRNGGDPLAAQNGGLDLIPGRVSVLAISNPVVEDSGPYTCALAGTDESVNIQLAVEEGGNVQLSSPVVTLSIIASPTTTADTSSNTDQSLIIFSTIGGTVVALIVVLAFCITTVCVLKQRRKTLQEIDVKGNEAYGRCSPLVTNLIENEAYKAIRPTVVAEDDRTDDAVINQATYDYPINYVGT